MMWQNLGDLAAGSYLILLLYNALVVLIQHKTLVLHFTHCCAVLISGEFTNIQFGTKSLQDTRKHRLFLSSLSYCFEHTVFGCRIS